MSYLKPQNPIQLGEDYIYPLTTSDQVILNNGNRLNSLFKKTIKENITLLSSDWSEALPYTQTITLNESTDDYNVDANVVYGGDNDVALNKAASCISYIKKNHKEITFYCLKKKPEIDIPVEVTCTCRNTIATVEDGVKLNFDVVAYGSEEELLADTPAENTIGIITDTPITGYYFSFAEPENMIDGEVWILIAETGDVLFNIIDRVPIYPLSTEQYVNGEMVDRTAKIYINGVWNDLQNGYLYKDGNEFESITGGWTANGYSASISSGAVTTIAGTKNEDHLYIHYSTTSKCSMFGTEKMVDLSNADTLEITCEKVQGGDMFFIASQSKSFVIGSTAPYIMISNSGTHTLDVSNINSAYIIVSPRALGYTSGVPYWKITRVRCF